MILQEKIKKEADRLVQLAPESLEGVNFNPKLPWISVEEDLPCNHEHLYEMTGQLLYTKKVLVMLSDGQVKIDYMLYNDKIDQWKWGGRNSEVLFWTIIPEL